MGKKKQKTKVIYRNIKQVESSVNIGKVKDELKELEVKRSKIQEEIKQSKEGKKGFSRFAVGLGGFAKQASINKAIHEKRKVLGISAGTEKARLQIQSIKQRTELEKAKSELREMQKKNQVNFGTGNQSNQITFESLFK